MKDTPDNASHRPYEPLPLSTHDLIKETKMFCATSIYPNQDGRMFDLDHYSKTLAPIYAEFLGGNCVRYEVRRGLMTPGAPMPAFALIASYWVRSDKEYMESLADPRFPDIMAKFAAFTDVEPIRQFDEVLTGDSGS